RFGYRRVFVMLKREGLRASSERVRRLYREEGLSLRLRPKRRRKLASHLRVVAPTATTTAGTLEQGLHRYCRPPSSTSRSARASCASASTIDSGSEPDRAIWI